MKDNVIYLVVSNQILKLLSRLIKGNFYIINYSNCDIIEILIFEL